MAKYQRIPRRDSNSGVAAAIHDATHAVQCKWCEKEKKRTLVQFEACIPRCQLIVEVEVRLDRAGLGGGGVLGGRLGGGVDLGVGCFRALREEYVRCQYLR